MKIRNVKSLVISAAIGMSLVSCGTQTQESKVLDESSSQGDLAVANIQCKMLNDGEHRETVVEKQTMTESIFFTIRNFKTSCGAKEDFKVETKTVRSRIFLNVRDLTPEADCVCDYTIGQIDQKYPSGTTLEALNDGWEVDIQKNGEEYIHYKPTRFVDIIDIK